jgi:hypothetical protein
VRNDSILDGDKVCNQTTYPENNNERVEVMASQMLTKGRKWSVNKRHAASSTVEAEGNRLMSALVERRSE